MVLTLNDADVNTLERGRIFATWKEQALHVRPHREPFKSLEAQGRIGKEVSI